MKRDKRKHRGEHRAHHGSNQRKAPDDCAGAAILMHHLAFLKNHVPEKSLDTIFVGWLEQSTNLTTAWIDTVRLYLRPGGTVVVWGVSERGLRELAATAAAWHCEDSFVFSWRTAIDTGIAVVLRDRGASRDVDARSIRRNWDFGPNEPAFIPAELRTLVHEALTPLGGRAVELIWPFGEVGIEVDIAGRTLVQVLDASCAAAWEQQHNARRDVRSKLN